MGTYEIIMVILAIVTALMGVANKFFWNKLSSYDKQHEMVNREVKELDERLSARMSRFESRATTLESTIVTKDDLFSIVNTLREDGVRRDERIYDKLESLSNKVEAVLHERAKDTK